MPFVSSLPSEREIKVEPHLAFALDGSRFDSAAAATPFAERATARSTSASTASRSRPTSAICHAACRRRLRAATLGADLVVAFERRPKLSLKISGTVGADGIEVVDAAAAELLRSATSRSRSTSCARSSGGSRIKSIDVDAPHVVAVRDGAGRVNLLLATEAPSGERERRRPAASADHCGERRERRCGERRRDAAAAKTPAPRRGRRRVAALSVRAGRLDWRDATTSPSAALALSDFSLAAKAIAWPLDAPVVFKRRGHRSAARHDHGKLSFSGQGNAAAATVKVTLAELPMAALRPYLSRVLAPPLSGRPRAPRSRSTGRAARRRCVWPSMPGGCC